MDAERNRDEILAVIESYSRSLGEGDVERWESLFWHEDPNFTELENDRDGLLGGEYIREISGFLQKQGESEPDQRWYDTSVYLLTPDTAYSVSRRDEKSTGATARVTLIFQKKQGRWRIIHGHFSNAPE